MLNVARLEGEAAAGAAAALRLDVGEPPFARAGEPPFACAGADAGGAVVAREIRGIFFFFSFSDVRALFKKVTTRLLATYSLTPG